MNFGTPVNECMNILITCSFIYLNPKGEGMVKQQSTSLFDVIP